MGDGLVLEHGNHDQLLSRGGAYNRLVQAQKLREQESDQDTNDKTYGSSEKEDMEKIARDEIPLGRKNTGRSLASEIIEQKQNLSEDNKNQAVHGLFYLFMRMGHLNRESWSRYIVGFIFACSRFYFCSFHVNPNRPLQ